MLIGIFMMAGVLSLPVLAAAGETVYSGRIYLKSDFSSSAVSYVSGTEQTSKALLSAECRLSKKTCVYNGKEKKPSVKVTYQGKKLKKGQDYTLSYENNTNVGTAYAVVRGIGNYTGTVRLLFRINPPKVKGLSLKSTNAGSLEIEWKAAGGGVTGYEVNYWIKNGAKQTISVTGTKQTISGLKEKQSYFVRVRAFAKGNSVTCYGAWSSTKTGKVSGSQFDLEAELKKYDDAEKTMIKKGKALFTALEEMQTKAREDVKNIIGKQIARPVSLTKGLLPEAAYKEFLNYYYQVIDGVVEFNLSSYADVKSSADLVNKITGELVDKDGKFTFQVGTKSYTCVYKKVGALGVSLMGGKVVDDQTKTEYLWLSMAVSNKNIKTEVDRLKQTADMKLQEAEKACFLAAGKAIGVDSLQTFLEKVTKGKTFKMIEAYSPELADYVKKMMDVVVKFQEVKSSYESLTSIDISKTDEDEILRKLNQFESSLVEWQRAVTAL